MAGNLVTSVKEHFVESVMGNLVVGDEGCKFNRVITAMKRAGNYEDISNIWQNIANDMQIRPDVINRINRNIRYENWSATPIMMEILPNWRGVASTDATLDKLLTILKDNQMLDMCNEIRNEFNLSNNR